MVTQSSLWELVCPVVHSDLFASVTLDPSVFCLLSKRSGMASLSCLLVCLSFSVSGIRSRRLRMGLRVLSERLKTTVPRGVTGLFWEAWVAGWDLLGDRES